MRQEDKVFGIMPGQTRYMAVNFGYGHHLHKEVSMVEHLWPWILSNIQEGRVLRWCHGTHDSKGPSLVPPGHGFIVAEENCAPSESGMREEQHLRGLQLPACPRPSLRTPRATRNGEAHIFRKIIVKVHQPQEADRG